MPHGIEVLGDDFAAKMEAENIKKRQRLAKLELDEQTKKEIVKLVKKNIKPEAPLTNYIKKVKDVEQVYNIVLAETTKGQVRVYEQKYGPCVLFNWNGMTLGVYRLDAEQIGRLEPDTYYVLIGQYNERMKGTKKYYNFNAHAILTMDDIAEVEGIPPTDYVPKEEPVSEPTQPEAQPEAQPEVQDTSAEPIEVDVTPSEGN